MKGGLGTRGFLIHRLRHAAGGPGRITSTPTWLLFLIFASVGFFGLGGGTAPAATGAITRAQASADWTEGSVAGTASWSTCGKAGCRVTPFVTIGASTCSAEERGRPHSSADLTLAWEGGGGTVGGSESFDVREVPLSGEPDQIACLTLLETYEERPACQLHPEPGIACPQWIAVVQNPIVLDEVPLTQTAEEAPSIEGESISGITSTDATLEADINTGGLATNYRFRLAYGCGFAGEVCPQFCVTGQPCPGPQNSVITIPLPSADLSPTPDTQHVSLDLNSVGVTLEPYKYRFVVEATNAKGTATGAARYFTPSPPGPSPSSLPAIESESVSNIGESGATLSATVNPGGLETEYEFWLQYAVCQNPPAGSGACQAISSERRATGTIPAGSTGKSIGTTLTGLTPGYSYTFWVVATNAKGEVDGSDQPFSTSMPAPAPEPPTILSESATGITETDATLSAEVDPHGLFTAYRFQIDTNGSYDFPRPACPLELPGYATCEAMLGGEALPTGLVEPSPGVIQAGASVESVSVDLAGIGATLEPGRTYHYRVIAANTSDGRPVYGPDRSFTTASGPSGTDQDDDAVLSLSDGGSTPVTGPGTATDPSTSSTPTQAKAPVAGRRGRKVPKGAHCSRRTSKGSRGNRGRRHRRCAR